MVGFERLAAKIGSDLASCESLRDTYALGKVTNRRRRQCHYQNEKCHVHALAIVVVLGRQLLQQLQIAASANSRSCNTLHALHVARIRIAKY